MTDTTFNKELAEPFWSRVRAALGALRPVSKDTQAEIGQLAFAKAHGRRSKPGPRIEEALAKGWASAAARRVSLSVLVIEIDRMPEYLAAYGKPAADDCAASVMQAVADNLPHEGDICLRWDGGAFVAVLPDLPVLMARASAARIHDAIRHLGLIHKESHAGAVTVSIGLAVNNPAGSYDKKFFHTAMDALKKAQRKGLGRLETIDLRPVQERKRKKAA